MFFDKDSFSSKHNSLPCLVYFLVSFIVLFHSILHYNEYLSLAIDRFDRCTHYTTLCEVDNKVALHAPEECVNAKIYIQNSAAVHAVWDTATHTISHFGFVQSGLIFLMHSVSTLGVIMFFYFVTTKRMCPVHHKPRAMIERMCTAQQATSTTV
jgi:hypothetical protein